MRGKRTELLDASELQALHVELTGKKLTEKWKPQRGQYLILASKFP